jgi:outer membrane protein OmpA-like peptidoglycan-associated protein
MFKLLKNIKLLILAVAALAFTASGCIYAQEAGETLKPIVPKTKDQKIKVYNYLLSEQGVDQVHLGDNHTIVISSDRLFTTGSANFNSQYLRNLKIIAQVINLYNPMQIAVNAYTSGPGVVEKALTEKQAQKVMTYLQQQGVSARLFFAKGFGDAYPVAINNRNSSFNRRIEIQVQSEPEQQKVY